MQKTLTLPAALAAVAVLGTGALAQTPPPPPPAHHGIFSKLLHPHAKPQPMPGSFGRPGHMMPGHMMPGHMMPGHMMPGHMMPGHSGTGGMMPMHGGVIANKNSRVYHLPGDRGALPAAQNRVYFSSAAAAEAAGYHRAGGAHSTMGRRPMMQGSPMHGMPGRMTH